MKIPLLVIIFVLFATAASGLVSGKMMWGETMYGQHVIKGTPDDRHAVEMLLDESKEPAFVDAWRIVSELKGRFLLDSNTSVEEAVLNFIDRHRNAFGLKNPKAELKLIRNETDKWGLTDINYQQVYNGVPLWNIFWRIHLDKNKEIYEISTGNTPTPDINTTPRLTPDEAFTEVEKVGPIIKILGLVVYKGRLAYGFERSYEIVFVDANDGHIIAKIPTFHENWDY